jgi:ankyrin repeat protein
MNLNKLFIEAVKLGILPVIKQLVEAGSNVRIGDDCALRYTTVAGRLDIVKYLVSVGSNVRANDDGALRWAEYYGHTAVVDYLKSEIAKLENKAKVL